MTTERDIVERLERWRAVVAHEFLNAPAPPKGMTCYPDGLIDEAAACITSLRAEKAAALRAVLERLRKAINENVEDFEREVCRAAVWTAAIQEVDREIAALDASQEKQP